MEISQSHILYTVFNTAFIGEKFFILKVQMKALNIDVGLFDLLVFYIIMLASYDFLFNQIYTYILKSV